MMKITGLIPLLVFVLLLLPVSAPHAEELLVLEFELKDLTLNPDTKGETERTRTLRPLLVEQLSEPHGHKVPDNPPSAAIESEKGNGYLFERPGIAASIGQEANVDWVLVGRLHKASFLFVYLRAQLIDVHKGAVAADFVVEIKGPQKKLTKKGVESLAVQVSDALEALSGK